jgi:ornithine cyclodeaminase/alanine dehydrogenase-like protein (mu-crystallin family)
MALIINNEVAAQLMSMQGCLEALERVFRELGRGEAVDRNKSSIHVPTDNPDLWYRYCSMEGASRELQVAAIRIKSDMIQWPAVNGRIRETKYTGKPGLFGGLILLFSSQTGELLAVLNDGFIQHLRVAGTYGLGVKYTARSDARTLGMIGSGAMARFNAEAYSLVRPLKQIRVFSTHPAHRNQFALEMAEQLQTEVIPVDSPQAAANGADILASMTDSIDPVIYPKLLEPGMCLCTVTNLEMSQAAYYRVDRMVLARTSASDHHFTTPESQRPRHVGGSHQKFVQWESVIPKERVDLLSDVMLGRAPGRETDNEIVFFQSEGMGTQFAAVAAAIYERARETGLGQELPQEWFLQDIRT